MLNFLCLNVSRRPLIEVKRKNLLFFHPIVVFVLSGSFWGGTQLLRKLPFSLEVWEALCNVLGTYGIQSEDFFTLSKDYRSCNISGDNIFRCLLTIWSSLLIYDNLIVVRSSCHYVTTDDGVIIRFMLLTNVWPKFFSTRLPEEIWAKISVSLALAFLLGYCPKNFSYVRVVQAAKMSC